MNENPMNSADSEEQNVDCDTRVNFSARTKKNWSKMKAAVTLTGMHVLAAEKHNALQVISELKNCESDKKTLQGNAALYSMDNLKKRKALKRHPQVASRIQDLWDLVTIDSSESHITKENFVALMVRLHFLMVKSSDDFEKILEAAEEDWIKDAGGMETMSREKFTDSMFELVDVWTDSVTLEEYQSLLDTIVGGVSVLDKTGLSKHRVFKDLADVKFDEVFSEHDDSTGTSANNLTLKNGADLCWDDDLAVIEAQRAMWEYEQSFASFKQKKWVQLQGAAKIVGLHAKTSAAQDARESELLYFSQEDGKRQIIMKPNSIMKTIAKIYDAKIVQDKLVEGLRYVISDEEGGRFDRFVFLWHVQQFGSRQRGIEHLRLLLRSVSRLACSHPRLWVFGKMVGLPVKAMNGVEEFDHKFKPRAASEYLFPFFRCFLQENPKTGQLERLEDWFGSDFTPKRVGKTDFLLAAEKTLRFVPRTSPAVLQFYSEIESLYVDEEGWKKQLQQQSVETLNIESANSLSALVSPRPPDQLNPKKGSQMRPAPNSRSSPRSRPLSTQTTQKIKSTLSSTQNSSLVIQRPEGFCLRRNTAVQQKMIQPKSLQLNTVSFGLMVSSNPSKLNERKDSKTQSSTTATTIHRLKTWHPQPPQRIVGGDTDSNSSKLATQMNSTSTLPTNKQYEHNKNRYLDIDRGVCLLLRVWDADYQWKQVITTISAITMLKRYIQKHRCREKKIDDTRNSERCTELVRHSSKTANKFHEAQMLDQQLSL